MKKPINTTDEATNSPLMFLAESLVFGGSGAIERQEAIGQSSFVNSETLPTDIQDIYPSGESGKALLESFGVKFLDPVEGDPLFQYVELPKGWSKRATGHSMWSDLVDDKGRKRAAIFYKAAFYDRGAHLSLTRRFSIRLDYDRSEKEHVWSAQILDGDKVIQTTGDYYFPSKEARWEMQDQAKAAAVAWLNEHWPNWESPAAYWEAE